MCYQYYNSPLCQFDNKEPEDLELEFDHFDAANSYPTSPFKGRNIVDLDFMHKQLLDEHKPCITMCMIKIFQGGGGRQGW